MLTSDSIGHMSNMFQTRRASSPFLSFLSTPRDHAGVQTKGLTVLRVDAMNQLLSTHGSYNICDHIIKSVLFVEVDAAVATNHLVVCG